MVVMIVIGYSLILSYWKLCSFVFMYFRTSKFYHKTKRRKGYKKIEILYINEIYKCLVAVNCINRSEKDIRLFPADNIRRQLAILL